MTKADKEGQRKAPILRFKGFTDAWEQRKLGNLFNERKEKSTKGELLSVTLSNGVTKFSDLNKKDNSNIKSGNYKVVKKNDIPYNSMRMWQGASGVSSYDGIVSPAYTVLVPNRNSNSNFYAVLFKKKSILNLFTRFSQGLTSDTWNLKYPILKDIIVPFTNLEEQKRIFKIFNVINNLLALYERKLKLLSQVKKYFLDNLFAEKEYPNLRFKGYEDTWLKSKFSKFLSIPEKVKVTIDSPSRILTVKLNLGGVQKGANRTTLKLNSTTYYLRKAGQLIYGKQNLFNGSLAIIPSQFEGYVTSGDVPSLNIDNIDKRFLYYYIARKSFYKKTEAYSSGTGSKRIHEKTFLGFNIVYPEDLKEQEKISKLISSINSNIELYRSKKNNLMAIKKNLLNTMFI